MPINKALKIYICCQREFKKSRSKTTQPANTFADIIIIDEMIEK